jgi:alpha-glucosidase (family GH31 glycosyl hydrolase)
MFQYFALGHHQCRWNYNDQDDVRMVDNMMDEYDIPNDVMWLDIEHTDSKKYVLNVTELLSFLQKVPTVFPFHI